MRSKIPRESYDTLKSHMQRLFRKNSHKFYLSISIIQFCDVYTENQTGIWERILQYHLSSINYCGIHGISFI